MNQSELNDAFNEAINEMKAEPKEFVITYVAAMVSLLYLRGAMMAIIDNPKHAGQLAEHALEGIEEFSPTEIAKSFGMAAEGALN